MQADLLNLGWLAAGCESKAIARCFILCLQVELIFSPCHPQPSLFDATVA